jgi:hypothetical protein
MCFVDVPRGANVLQPSTNSPRQRHHEDERCRHQRSLHHLPTLSARARTCLAFVTQYSSEDQGLMRLHLPRRHAWREATVRRFPIGRPGLFIETAAAVTRGMQQCRGADNDIAKWNSSFASASTRAHKTTNDRKSSDGCTFPGDGYCLA